MGSVSLSVALTHEMQNQNRYVRVPFEVPAGTDSFEVRLSYPKNRGIVDLGCEGPEGWCGWSGGTKDNFVIRPDDATPGYLPGRPTPGEWAVFLGIHTLAPGGLTAELKISFPAESAIDHGPEHKPTQGIRRGSSRDLPAPDGMTWFAGDFHAHTVHSDGQESISGLAALGTNAGLDFLAVTDHNTTSHHPHLKQVGKRHGITLLPGQEVTTHRGHANAFGDIGWVDFRATAQEWLLEVDRRGGVLSVNHPISGDCSWIHPLTQKPHALELWHSTWFQELISTAPLGFFALWDRSVTLLGGSDFHRRADAVGPGTPTTWVAAEDSSPEALLAAVAAGRTAIMGGVTVRDGLSVPDVLTAPVLLRVADEVIAVDAEGLILVNAHGERRIVSSRHQAYSADPAEGPYYLLHPDRQIAALSA